MGKYLFKEGHVREDGMIYWRYRKDKGHVWITQEQYKKYVETRKKYRELCLKEYYKQRSKLNVMDQSFYGKYCFAKNRYFIGVGSSGKEIWTTKEKYLKHRDKQNRNRRNFIKKLKSQPKPDLKIGDPHPDNKDLFVCYFIGNKPYFGSEQKLKTVVESRKTSIRKRDIKYKRLRKERLAQIEKKHRRGDVHPENKTLFWEYNIQGKEKWLPFEEFKLRHDKEKERRRINRLKQKGLCSDQ